MQLTIDLDVVAAKMAEFECTTEWDYDLMQALEEVYGLESAVKKIMVEKHKIDLDEYMC